MELAVKRALIRDFLKNLLQSKGDPAPFDDEDSLLLTGRIDSLNVLEVVELLQDKMGFEMSDHDFDQTKFDSVDSIVALVAPA